MNLREAWSSLICFINGLPKTELIIGIVVPISAAWISYALVERATRRKESNRLYIETELILRELNDNLKNITYFISLVTEYKEFRERLMVKIPFSQDILYKVLLKLKNISDNYFHFDQHIFEKPNCLYIFGQRLKEIENEIKEVELNTYDSTILDQNKQIRIAQLLEAKQQVMKDFKNNQERDIYIEFKNIQKYIDNNLMEGLIEKLDQNVPTSQGLFYIYTIIKNFNNLSPHTKDDVIKIYKDLLVFEISNDVTDKEVFNQDEFDLFYEARYGKDPIYSICKDFYKLLELEKKINSFSFKYYNSRWKEVSNNLVMLNDSSLFISIYDFYENYEKFIENCLSCNRDMPNLKEVEDKCNDFSNGINQIKERLSEKQLKIKKWCS
jgi:hypothetical protein